MPFSLTLFLFDSARKFWELMVQRRWVLMSPMGCFLSAHGNGSLTRMVSTCILLSLPLSFELILIFIAFLISISESSEKAFSYFWITDSCPLTVKAIANKAPFEVLSLAGSIADGLQIWKDGVGRNACSVMF